MNDELAWVSQLHGAIIEGDGGSGGSDNHTKIDMHTFYQYFQFCQVVALFMLGVRKLLHLARKKNLTAASIQQMSKL